MCFFHFNENSEWAQNATPTIYLLVTILNYVFSILLPQLE